MAGVEDLYAILQVPPHAKAEIIQTSYRRLAMLYHPDRNPERRAWAEERMKVINAAYAVLSNVSHRQSYDRRRFGVHVPRSSARPAPPPPPPPPRRPANLSELENDWFYLHVYAQGRTVPEVEESAENRLERDMAEFIRLVAPPEAGSAPLIDLLNSAATGQYVAYTPYGQLIARLTLRAILPPLREYAEKGAPDATHVRQLVAQVNDLVQDRMGAEGLKMVVKGKNIVADWAGLLLTIVNFLWGDA